MNNLALNEQLLDKQVQKNTKLDKKQVERQFERSAQSYNQAAELQQSIIEDLIEAIGEHTKSLQSAKQIADLGCGTGLGLAALKQSFPNTELIGVDIAQAMLSQASIACPTAGLIKADIEQLPAPEQSFDLAFTTSTLQWCDLNAVLNECYRVLQPGGCLALATFGPKTHQEWKTAWERVDGVKHTLDFLDQATINHSLEMAGFAMTQSWIRTHVLEFDSAEAVLQSVKSLGATNANAHRQRGLMGKNRFQKFLQTFEALSSKPRLTYEVIFTIAKKS